MKAALLVGVDEPLVVEALVTDGLGPHAVRVRIDAFAAMLAGDVIRSVIVPPAPATTS